MSTKSGEKTTEQTLTEFNNDIEKFISENKDRILSIMGYAVSFDMQPYVASYQRYYNHDIISRYDSKTIYAYNLELPNFLNVYMVLKKANDNTSNEDTRQECINLINKFNKENEHVLAGLSAFIYETGNPEKVEEIHHGDKDSLKEIKFFNN